MRIVGTNETTTGDKKKKKKGVRPMRSGSVSWRVCRVKKARRCRLLLVRGGLVSGFDRGSASSFFLLAPFSCRPGGRDALQELVLWRGALALSFV